METDRLTQLEQRLAQVEEELRQATRASRRSHGLPSLALVALGGLALVAAIGLGTASAAPNPQDLTVKTLRIADGNGVAMQLTSGGIDVYSGAVSVLRGGHIVSKLSASAAGGGSITVYNANGDVAGAMQTRSGWGELVVNGPDGRARLGTDANTWQTLRFYNGTNVVTGVGITEGSGLLQVNDAAGHKMATVANNGKSGVVSLFGDDGNPKVLMSSAQGTFGGALTLYNASGGPVVTMQATEAAGSFAIANAAGTARVQAGVLAGDKGVVRAYGPKAFDYISGR